MGAIEMTRGRPASAQSNCSKSPAVEAIADQYCTRRGAPVAKQAPKLSVECAQARAPASGRQATRP